MTSRAQRQCAEYHVAWICPVANLELLPARLMLDEEHVTPPYNTHYDENTYICGSIAGHNVVVATCPQGETGNVNAGRLTGPMFKTFPSIRMTVLVGIGGGIPHARESTDPMQSIHLGDVVVGWPGDGKPACVYHERCRWKVDGGFEMVGTMQNPDWRLTNALAKLVSDHELGRTSFEEQRKRLQKHRKFDFPGAELDRLYRASYHHVGDYGSDCAACCGEDELIRRPVRAADSQGRLIFHQGRIATGNSVVQDGERRDKIGTQCDGALCVEMEAAGVDANRKCLVVRGISDYADSHKSDVWRTYAAGNAAVFARELLCHVQPAEVSAMESGTEEVKEALWLVPFARPRSFVGRDDQRAQLRQHISSEGGRRLAVYGLGGCGKTALALETAYLVREQDLTRAVFWVPAIGSESFEQAYREIGMVLKLSGTGHDRAGVKRRVKARLSDETFGPWLMIVDNADDVDVLVKPVEGDRSAERLIDCLPHSRRGSIIFTTRTRKVALKLADHTMELGELNDREAKEILWARLLPKHHHQLEHHGIVSDFLGTLTFLALAVVQAVAFVNENSTTLAEYVQIYRESEDDAIQLLSREFEDQGRYHMVEKSVATTWHISFRQIQRQSQLATDYLSLMACTTGEGVPRSLLWPGRNKLATVEAIGLLGAYAFVSQRHEQAEDLLPSGQAGLLDMHRLVRLATRNWLAGRGQWGSWVLKAVQRMVEVLPYSDHGTVEAWKQCVPHAMYMAHLPESRELEDCLSLLDRIGACAYKLGQYAAAETAYGRALARREASLGKEHPHTLTSMNNLALVLNSQGNYAEAERMHRATLALTEEILGKEHPDTLASMNNLAQALSNQGKYAEAERMNRATLALREEILGKEHPDTLTSKNNLALVLNCQGNYAEAERMHRVTLALKEKLLGKGHSDTLASINNLALAVSNQERYAEAEQMYRTMLILCEKLIGKEHPHTLRSMDNLAGALSGQKKYVEAEKVYRATLALKEKTVGKEHPDTLMSLNNLAATLGCQGKYAEAEQIYRATLALMEKTISIEHPEMVRSINNLTMVLRGQRKHVEAERINLATPILREVRSRDH